MTAINAGIQFQLTPAEGRENTDGCAPVADAVSIHSRRESGSSFCQSKCRLHGVSIHSRHDGGRIEKQLHALRRPDVSTHSRPF